MIGHRPRGVFPPILFRRQPFFCAKQNAAKNSPDFSCAIDMSVWSESPPCPPIFLFPWFPSSPAFAPHLIMCYRHGRRNIPKIAEVGHVSQRRGTPGRAVAAVFPHYYFQVCWLAGRGHRERQSKWDRISVKDIRSGVVDRGVRVCRCCFTFYEISLRYEPTRRHATCVLL